MTWTKDDLPKAVRYPFNNAAHNTLELPVEIREVLADYLNDNFPKDSDAEYWRAAWVSSVEDRRSVERERDEWKARAKQAEARNAPAFVPLRQRHGTHMDASHLPSDPGESVSAYIERRYGSPGSLDAFWPNTAPAVTRADVEKAIYDLRTFPRFLTDELLVQRDRVVDALMELLSGDDPAVYVVRESDIEAQEFTRTESGGFVVQGTLLNTSTAKDAREKADRHLDAVSRCEAIARAIEAEAQSPDPDPVEEQADALAGILYPEGGAISGDVMDALERVVRAGMLFPEGGDCDE